MVFLIVHLMVMIVHQIVMIVMIVMIVNLMFDRFRFVAVKLSFGFEAFQDVRQRQTKIR